MKPANEHSAHDAILALLDGDLTPTEADGIRARIDADPALAKEETVWRAMFDDLHAIGDDLVVSVPKVELWDAVQSRLTSATDGQDAGETWTFDQLLDLAEGRLEQRAAAELRERIDQSDALKQEYAWLVSVRDDLGERGDSIANASPTIDLLPAIMHAVTTRADEPEIEDLFASLLDWRDGQLPLPDSDQLRRMADESDDVRAANAWLNETAEELELFGDRIISGAPGIDVTDAVMDAVRRISEPDTIVTLDAERLRRRTRWRMAGGLAAAAMVVMGVGWIWFTAEQSGQTVQQIDKPVIAKTEPDREEMQENILRKRESLPTRPKRRKIATGGVDAPVTLASTETPKLDALDADAILAARRKAANTGDWTEFQQLATLTREQAIELAEKQGLPPGALVGLADSLMPNEAEKALLTVVGVLPDSPYLQLALLETVVEQSPGEAQSEDPLAFSQKISDLDPGNALSYYLEAKMFLKNGDPESAIAALLEAQALEYATPYSLEAAANRQSALIANGMEPETAQLLAAFNAGNEEADALFDLAVDLLEYGNYYDEIGDFDTARAIFEGVQLLGDQIEAGAVLSQEQLVALDIQSAAIDVLAQFYAAQGIVEALAPLTEQSINILGDLDSLNVFFVQLNTMLGDIMDPTFWEDVVGIFLTEGDLAILDYLEDWGIPIDSP